MTSKTFEQERVVAKAMHASGVINARQLAQRLRQINRREGQIVYKKAEAALKALNEYQDRVEREPIRLALLRKLSLSLRRYEHVDV